MKSGFGVVMLYLLLITLGTGVGCGGVGSPTGADPAGDLPTQGWTLTNDAGDMAYVIVKPFTYSGTFTEAGNSPGWWSYDGAHNRVARVPVNGSIAHAGQYDTWDFAITVQGGGMRITGQGTGRSIGAYPSAREVQGTISGTATSPAGSQRVSNTWSGNDYTVWH
jgi:hypothetical protein